MHFASSRRYSMARQWPHWFAAGTLAVALAGCGGGGIDDAGVPSTATALASGITTIELDSPAIPESATMLTVQPSFHVAPVLLPEPEDTDAQDPGLTTWMMPRTHAVMAGLGQMSGRGLTPEAIADMQTRLMDAGVDGQTKAAATVVSTYTPAQIRAAYGFSAVPAAGVALNPTQAAALGAGQTIYIVAAYHNPNAAVELAAFSQKFGLPACANATVAVGTMLPLTPAPVSGCQFSVVYSTASGAMTATPPAYNAGWATEMALDVQWAHATAPWARIVLIESADASIAGITGAIALANRMGPGVVSMSLGALEGSWTSSVEPVFSGANMAYVAATGDSGAAVSWPAVSPRVLGVGGTTLNFAGTGSRSEVTWSGTGGGTSLYTLAPSYQNNSVPGLTAGKFRRVSDVAFNADPATGQYVATLPPGTTAVRWISAGGTSLATPQWAGLIAMANASRALSGKTAMGAPHAMLYGQIAAVPGNYASTFLDITAGADGSCATCFAKFGYDNPTGLGTPNVSSLMGVLSGVAAAPVAPVVTSASIAGSVGSALSFTVSVVASNPVAYTLAGAPTGMTIGPAGVVTWASPVAGTYAMTVTAKDTKTGLSGQGVYTLTIPAPKAPVASGATITGKPGTTLSFAVAFTAINPLAYSLSGAPAGMSINSAGVVSWPSPVTGNYTVTVNAKDTKTALTGSAVYIVKIAASTPASSGPIITASPMVGVVGKALSGTITVTDPGVSSVAVTISGAPLGMGFSVSGMTLIAKWPSPVVGNYVLNIKATDSVGKVATASVPITITPK